VKDKQSSRQLTKKLRRPFQLLWIAAVFFLLATPFAARFKFLSSLEDATLSLRFEIRGVASSEETEPPIVLVGVDDRSIDANFDPRDIEKEPWLSEFQNQWPWARSLHGELLSRLLEDGAKTVAFDFLFPGEGTADQGFKQALIKAGAKAVLAFDLIPEETAIGEMFYRERLPSESVLPDGSITHLGFANIVPDDDGVVRRIVLETDIAYETIAFTKDPQRRAGLAERSKILPDKPALSLAAAESFSEGFKPNFDPQTGKSYLINYAGPSGWFTALSATDFFLPGRRAAVATRVDGAIVIIAPWSDFFKDDRPTPFGNSFGAEIHAHALRNLLLGNFLQSPGMGWRALCLAALSFLAAFSVIFPKNVALKSGLLVATFGIWLVGCQLAFNFGDLVLPVASGFLLLLVTGGGLLLFEYLLEQMERRQIKRYLSHYVSPSVTRILLEEGGGFERLGKGEVRAVSLLFSDIRGFTSASENRNPGELTAQLNEYFDEMVGPIFDTDGSLNKYIGDAVFAVWGDLYPRGEEVDAKNALTAALRMRQGLARLNQIWESKPNRIPFQIGIGLHQGDAFVGNIGHPARLEVAVMGEAVNIASRIESANKFYGTDILISESLVKTAEHPAGLMFVDRALLSGSTKPMNLYYPVEGADSSRPENTRWVAGWNKAVEDYQQRRFQEALDSFENLTEAPHRIRELYLERCRINLHAPPTSDWSPLEKLQK